MDNTEINEKVPLLSSACSFNTQKIQFKAKINFFLTSMLKIVLVRTLQFTKILIFYLFYPWKYKKLPSKAL